MQYMEEEHSRVESADHSSQLFENLNRLSDFHQEENRRNLSDRSMHTIGA